LATVSAASFAPGSNVATEEIVSGLGSALADNTAAAAAVPLPYYLEGTSVKVTDSAGVERFAPLFFASPRQVNFAIPAGTISGPATVTVAAGDGSLSAGTVNVSAVAPGLFSADSSGAGVAAAEALRVTASGSRIPVPVYQCSSGSCSSVPITLGSAGDQVYLTLYGTGIRGRSALSNVATTIGGIRVPVLFAGPQGSFPGLDQVNVEIPNALAGKGEVNVMLAVDGASANTVSVNIK
jgi:uncharacterized protein (TIGR03437 family)